MGGRMSWVAEISVRGRFLGGGISGAAAISGAGRFRVRGRFQCGAGAVPGIRRRGRRGPGRSPAAGRPRRGSRVRRRSAAGCGRRCPRGRRWAGPTAGPAARRAVLAGLRLFRGHGYGGVGRAGAGRVRRRRAGPLRRRGGGRRGGVALTGGVALAGGVTEGTFAGRPSDGRGKRWAFWGRHSPRASRCRARRVRPRSARRCGRPVGGFCSGRSWSGGFDSARPGGVRPLPGWLPACGSPAEAWQVEAEAGPGGRVGARVRRRTRKCRRWPVRGGEPGTAGATAAAAAAAAGGRWCGGVESFRAPLPESSHQDRRNPGISVT